jgi:hypothetical protein
MWLAKAITLAGFSLLLVSSRAPGSPDLSSRELQSEALQSGSAAPATAPPAQDTVQNSKVGASQPVITVRGLCSENGGKAVNDAARCSTNITREQFEKLMNALNPGGQAISPAGRQNLALAYVEVLAFEEAARKSGMEDSAQFREVLSWARLRTIADLYRRNLQEQFRNPSPEEIDSYYQQHLASFERVHLVRILVPREDFSGRDKNDFDKRALQAAQAAHERAAKGDDPGQIQKDVYSTLGLESPPATDLGNFRRADFLENEADEVFSLQPGEISRVQTELKSYVIYKVLSKETLPESQVKAEIAREIAQQKFKDAIKAVGDAAPAEFNEQYFGPMAPKPPLEAPVVPSRRPGR